jgi:DNA-binding response OmpR family regulator
VRSGLIGLLTQFRPDVARLDIGLPGMDGCEVARRLRRLRGLESVVLIAVTGYADEAHRRQCDGTGFAFYFVKPANPDKLATLLGALAREKGKRATGYALRELPSRNDELGDVRAVLTGACCARSNHSIRGSG